MPYVVTWRPFSETHWAVIDVLFLVLSITLLTLSSPIARSPPPPESPFFSVGLSGGDEAIFVLFTFALLL